MRTHQDLRISRRLAAVFVTQFSVEDPVARIYNEVGLNKHHLDVVL
jgi:hypothetical protein